MCLDFSCIPGGVYVVISLAVIGVMVAAVLFIARVVKR